MTDDIYKDHGYRSRTEYLRSLSEDYGVDLWVVMELASMLGPNEDFDGLVSMVQDAAEMGI
jgi:hypothetical protein